MSAQNPSRLYFGEPRSDVAAEDAVMMLAGPSLRTVPLTVHVALARVPARGGTDVLAEPA